LIFDDGEGTSFALVFTGIHAAFDYARNRSGYPPAMATDRFEQAGRLTEGDQADEREWSGLLVD
jgi:hypothetical protein